MVVITYSWSGAVETGYAEPPRQVDIDVALRAAGVRFYDKSRAAKIYLRRLRKKTIYDRLSIRELEKLCHDRNISLRDMPSILPGPVSHPWIQEGFKRLHTRLVEALEASEAATTFHRFLDLNKGMRLKIYGYHYDQMNLKTFSATPAIAGTSHMVRKEALSVYFDRSFELDIRTDEPSKPPYMLSPPNSVSSPSSTKSPAKKFLDAPPDYANRIRRLTICRWVKNQHKVRADHGTWQVDLDITNSEDRVRWVHELGQAYGYKWREKADRGECKNIDEATSRLRKAVDIIMKNGGKLCGEDARSMAKALNNQKN